MGFCKCLKRVPYATITWTTLAVFGAALALCAFNGVSPDDSKFKIDEDIHKVTIGNWSFWVVLSFLALDLLILFVSFFTTGATREACCKGHGCFKKFGLLIMYTLFTIAFLVTLGLIVCFFYSTQVQTMGKMVAASREADVIENINEEIVAETGLQMMDGDAKKISDIVIKFTTQKVIEQEMSKTIGKHKRYHLQNETVDEEGNPHTEFVWVDEEGNPVLESARTNDNNSKLKKVFDEATKQTEAFAHFTAHEVSVGKNELVNYLLELDATGSLKWLFYGILCLLFAHICLSITLRGNSIKAKDEEKTTKSATYGHGQIDV